MITVTARPLSQGGLALEMRGHAGAPVNLEGHDLVCAAASILCLTLAQVVKAHCPQPLMDMAPGQAHLQGTPPPGGEAAFQAAWQGILMGFELLQAQYPHCLEVVGWR